MSRQQITKRQNHDIMSVSEKNALVHSASGEVQSCAVFAHDIMSVSEKNALVHSANGEV